MDLRIALDRRAQVEEFHRRHRTALVMMLFSDIVGSTKLKQIVGDRDAIDAIQRHHAVFREILTHFEEAAEIGVAGDSFFIVFTTPSDAVKFSLLVQRRLRQLAAETGYHLFDRIGIHVGEVWVKKTVTLGTTNELYGIQVDTCARVSSLGDSDQVLLTRFAFDSARQALKGEDLENISPLLWLSHGLYVMKGVDEPVEVCEVGEKGKAKLTLPPDTQKAHRFIPTDSEPVLGWRPAVDQQIPGTGWVLEKKLGEGGFGEVWLGRDKVLKTRRIFKFCFRVDRVRSLKREVTLFRLLRERIGTHPNIVSVEQVYFDKPPFYIVMQYIEGGNDLATWCLAHAGLEKIPLAVRLEIVYQVADALQAAHESGIIHRDVKPSNIIVSGSVAGDVRSHLTDFGIGTVVSREILAGMTQQLGFTKAMVGADSKNGTYMYMAPELLRGEPASAASDIYSLAVVLFQFLAGDLQRPLTADWAKSITEPLLRGDVSRGLATDPAERFASAKDFAEALRSLPRRRADAARSEADARAKEIISQRRRKRARLLQLAGAAVVCIILAAWIMEHQKRAAQEIRKASEALAAAQTDNQLLRAIMEYPKVEAQVRQSPENAATLQERVYGELGKQLGLDPKVLRERLPQFAQKLKRSPNASNFERANAAYADKDYTQAERLAVQVADEARKAIPPALKDAVAALKLAGLAAQKSIQYARAMEHFREAEKLTDRESNPANWAEVQHVIAELLVDQGHYGSAEKILRSVVEVRTRVLGFKHPDTLRSRVRLAWALGGEGKHSEADAELHNVIKLQQTVLGPEHPDTLRTRNGLTVELMDQGKNAEAEAQLRELIGLYDKVLGSEHTDTLHSRSNLAVALMGQGKNAEAEAQYRELITLYKKVLGPEHPDALINRNNLAIVLMNQGKYAEAEARFHELTKLIEKVLGSENPHTLATWYNLALTLMREGKYAEAEARFHELTKLVEKVLGPENPHTLETRYNLALTLMREGKYSDAEMEFRAILSVQQKLLGPESVETLDARHNVAWALISQGKHTDGEKQYREVIKLKKKVLGPENARTLVSMNGLAWALMSEGKYAEAERQYRDVIKLREKVLGPEHADTFASRAELATALRLEGKYSEADAECREVISLNTKMLGPENPRTLAARDGLAWVLDSQGKYAQAESEFRDVIKLEEKVLGPENLVTLESRNGLARTLGHYEGKYLAAESEIRSVIKL